MAATYILGESPHLWNMTESLPVAYTIMSRGLELNIAILETDTLLLHEEIIPESLEKLKRNIKKDMILQSPVIVDINSMVILDGMHRVSALQSLGCRLTPVCLVDYNNSEIVLDRWCRTVTEKMDVDSLASEASNIGARVGTLDPGSYDESCTSLISREKSYCLKSPEEGVLYEFNIVAFLESHICSMGMKVKNETFHDALFKLKSGEISIIVSPPRVEKEQVLEVTRRGQVFKSKATRHMIPARPIGLNIPLSILQDPNLTVEDANMILTSHLERKTIKRLPPGSMLNNRRYDEEIFIFEG